jgi:adenosine 3'-phospho 5'-phosphosulfate transporter B2
MTNDLESNRSGSTGNSSSSNVAASSGSKDGKSNRFSKLIFCFVGLQISYIAWGVVQENLMTREYKFGKFNSSNFCVFANRFLALIISFGIVFTQRMMNPNKVVHEAPFYYYAPSSLSNTLSSWAQYEALKFISFPTQVLSKSCKIIPVMLVIPSFCYCNVFNLFHIFVFL